MNKNVKSLAMTILSMQNTDLTPRAKRGGAAKHKGKLTESDS